MKDPQDIVQASFSFDDMSYSLCTLSAAYNHVTKFDEARFSASVVDTNGLEKKKKMGRERKGRKEMSFFFYSGQLTPN